MIATLQADEFLLVAASAISPGVKAHFQCDFHRTGAVASVESVTQAGEFGEPLGELNNGLMREPRKHRVFELVKLVFERGIDTRIGMAEQIDPPRGNGIEITLAIGIDQPRPLALDNGHQWKALVMLHLRTRMPYRSKRTRDEISVGSQHGLECSTALAPMAEKQNSIFDGHCRPKRRWKVRQC